MEQDHAVLWSEWLQSLFLINKCCLGPGSYWMHMSDSYVSSWGVYDGGVIVETKTPKKQALWDFLLWTKGGAEIINN